MVFRAMLVMRLAARMDIPSTSARRTAVCSSWDSVFMV
jgi:hypothetical protein